MIIPIRCYTCNKVIGNSYEIYKEIIKTKTSEEAFKEINIKKYCCKRMFLCHIDLIDKIINYK
jgi:DNA-directed RNA polymerase I, II, and III subunit RPABC5